MTKRSSSSAERLYTKEIISLVDQAGGQFASGATWFMDTAAIFEAIVAATPSGSLASRLANLGAGLCEQRESDFTEQQIAYEAHVDRFNSALQQSTEVCNG